MPKKNPSTLKYPTGRGAWRVRARPVKGRGEKDGRWYWRFEGWLPGGSPWTARDAAWLTQQEVVDELSRLYTSKEWLLRRPGQEAPERGSGPPEVLWQLVQQWLDHLKTLPPSECTRGTFTVRRTSANRLLYETYGEPRRKGKPCRWLARSIAQVPLTRLSEDVLRQHIRRRTAAGGSPNSIASEAEVVWLASRWGERKGWCRRVQRWRLSTERVRPRMTPDDDAIVELLPYLEQVGSGWAAIAVLIGVMAGMRIAEIGNLRLDQVHEAEVKVQPDLRQPLRSVPGLLFDVQVSKTGPREVLLFDSWAINKVRAWMASPRRDIQGAELHMLTLQAAGGSMELADFSEPGAAAIRINAHMGLLEAEGWITRRRLPAAIDAPFRVRYVLTEAGEQWVPPSNPSPYLLGVTPNTARTVNSRTTIALAAMNAARRAAGREEVARWTSQANRRRCIHRTIATGRSDPAGHRAQFGNTWQVALKDYVLENRVDASRVAALVPGLPVQSNVIPFTGSSTD